MRQDRRLGAGEEVLSPIFHRFSRTEWAIVLGLNVGQVWGAGDWRCLVAQRLPEPPKTGPQPLLHRPHPSHTGPRECPSCDFSILWCLHFTGERVVCPGWHLPGEELQRSPKPSTEQAKLLLRENGCHHTTCPTLQVRRPQDRESYTQLGMRPCHNTVLSQASPVNSYSSL